MNNAIELILILSMIISGFAGITLISSIILGYFLYDRLDKPNGIKRMRLLCHIIRICAFFYIILKVVQFGGLFVETKYYTPPSGFNVIMAVVVALIGIYFYFRYCRYYLNQRDNKEILANWYFHKHLGLIKKNQIQPAYECFQKIAELTPDSVNSWGALANFSGFFFEDFQLADKYLKKAQHTYEKNNKKESDLAILEHYRGQIMQLQNDHQTAIKHLQNAYELDPTDYRKKQYEEALTLAEEDNVQEDS